MNRYRFDAMVSFKGRVFADSYEVDADSLLEGLRAAKRFFSNKYGTFEVFGYDFLWQNEK